MDDGTVRIDELRLRVPGLSVEEGSALGQEIMRILSELSPEGIRRGNLAVLDLKVNISGGTSRNDLARILAERISEALR